MLSQEQLQRRKIGASDAPAIMGVSPWTTPYQLWQQKISGKGIESNRAMERGTRLEPEALRWFENKMGVKLDSQVFLVHKDHHFMTATLDGINEDKKIMVEIKCPNQKTHHVAASGKVIPDHHMPQLQHQMEVKGYDHMYYCSYDGSDGAILEVERDGEYISDLVEKERDFWRRVIEWDPPSLRDKDLLNKEDDEAWRVISEKWKLANESLKRMEEEEDELRRTLIKLAGLNGAIGNGVRISKFRQKGAIDYSQVPELKDVNLDSHRKPSFEKWKITLSKTPE